MEAVTVASTIPPEAIVASVAVAVTVLGGAYGYVRRGGTVEVDADSDGDAELTFEEKDEELNAAVREECQFTEDDGDPLSELETVATVPPLAVPEHVRDRSLEDVKGIGPTKAGSLEDAGYYVAADVYFAADERLTDVSGIGDHTVSLIREDIGTAEGN